MMQKPQRCFVLVLTELQLIFFQWLVWCYFWSQEKNGANTPMFQLSSRSAPTKPRTFHLLMLPCWYWSVQGAGTRTADQSGQRGGYPTPYGILSAITAGGVGFGPATAWGLAGHWPVGVEQLYCASLILFIFVFTFTFIFTFIFSIPLLS